MENGTSEMHSKWSPNLRGRAIAAVVGIGIVTIVFAMDAANNWRLLNGLSHVDRIPEQFARARVSFGIYVAVMVGAIFFCPWVYRAYENLSYFGAERLRLTPGWAAGAFFVPIVNLYLPYQTVQEICRASDPLVSTKYWQNSSGSNLIRLWWTVVIISIFTGIAAFQMVGRVRGNDLDVTGARAAMSLAVVSNLCAVVAGFLLIGVILDVTSRQYAKRRQLQMVVNNSPE